MGVAWGWAVESLSGSWDESGPSEDGPGQSEAESGLTEDGSGPSEDGSGPSEAESGLTEAESGPSEDGSGLTEDGSGPSEAEPSLPPAHPRQTRAPTSHYPLPETYG